MIPREKIEWCDIWVRDADGTELPRALMIGDSITRSYYPHVAQQLDGSYACARLTSSKCVADPGFSRELDLLLSDYEFTVIHFNNGLHGWDFDEDTYREGLAKAFDLLVAHCGAANLIWGSTTPVWDKETGELKDRNDRVIERNRIAADIAEERQVRINDLYAAVIEQPELFSPDGVHFLEDGQKVLAKRVVEAIAAGE